MEDALPPGNAHTVSDRKSLDFVVAKYIILLAARTLDASEAADKENRDTGGDHHGQEASIEQPMN